MDIQSIKILLVEDNPDDADLLRELLAEVGSVQFQIVQVERLHEAEEFLARDTCDIILLDLSLPDSQGLDTVRAMLDKTFEIPVMVLSGMDDRDLAIQAVQQGAQDYLVKGHVVGDLLGSSIRYAIERYQLVVELAQRIQKEQESEARFRQMIECHADGIFVVDHRGVVRFVNPAALALYGREQDELLGQVFGFPAVAGETTELDILRPDKRRATVEMRVVETVWDGEAAFLASLRDITERKRRETENQAVQGVRDAVQQMEGADDIQQVMAAVRAGLESLEVPFHWCGINIADESTDPPRVHFHNMTWEGEWHPGEHEEASRLNLQIWRGGTPVYRCDLEAEDRYQERSFTAAADRPVRAVLDVPFSHGTLAVSSPEPDAFSAQDIASLQTLVGVLSSGFQRLDDLQALEAKEAQLRQSQKMEAVGQLAGGVAHDFNNLITIITGYCQLLRKGLAPEDPRRAHLEQINQAGEGAATLVRQLLAFSRKQVLQSEKLDLNQVVAETEKMLGRLIGEDIELKTSLDPELGPVYADPGQLEQVLMNLVINARDAMPQGGKLTIETTNAELDDAYARQHAAVQPGSYVMLAVTDTGTGMDAETQAHIFEPFFTTKEVGHGTGLGLATVYGIVKQSEGSIRVYSEPGKGTTFKIYLPRIDAVCVPGRHEQTPEETSRGSETILLAEDNDMLRELARLTLAECGYNVLEACQGEEALQICEQHPNPIHLLVTDVVMPGMSGPELAEQVMPQRPKMKVIYTSGFMDHAIVRNGVLSPGTAFLPKPFNPDDLERKVREVLDGAPEG